MNKPTEEQIEKFRKDFYIKKNTPNDIVIEMYMDLHKYDNLSFSKKDMEILEAEIADVLGVKRV